MAEYVLLSIAHGPFTIKIKIYGTFNLIDIVEHINFLKKIHMYVHSRFTHNRQITTKMSINW